jgi:hypothetical protein
LWETTAFFVICSKRLVSPFDIAVLVSKGRGVYWRLFRVAFNVLQQDIISGRVGNVSKNVERKGRDGETGSGGAKVGEIVRDIEGGED